MPPKGKEAKKGAVAGNFKAGKPLKDILPPNSKPPREGQVARMEGEPEVSRSYGFEPMAMLPEWPGNEEAKAHDFKAGFEQDENGTVQKFTEPEPVDGVGQLHLPPSFHDFTKGEPVWMRPEEYIKEIMYEKEVQKRRQEKKREYRLRKTTRKNSLMALAAQASPGDVDMQQQQETELELLNKARQVINKDELVPEPKVIRYEERLETEAEVQKRKEAAEKAAAADKNAKKKAPPPKGAPATDPADEPQTLQIPIDGSLDMSFLMPKYTKWVTSQFQFIRDRAIRDVESSEAIWQRIYPQENGIPTVSPTGKYWVKLRFMGKERLVEIDDRMPCSNKGVPIFPRTTDHNEIWPQLLMKALLKVYSYKWFAANCQYDSEIGDGSIVYSLTGLIPEKVQIKDLASAQQLLRKHLADDYYFGKKAYLTCYCENEFRPKFPSQIATLQGTNLGTLGSAQKISGPGSQPGASGAPSDTASATSHQSSSKMMLSKLKDAASLAISVTTGRKPAFGAKEKSLTNIIPGFGYALMDVFENEFVDMDSISKQNTQIVEENLSPFASPAKSRGKRDKSMSKDEYKKQRREQRKKEQEERERKEKEPPTQYSFVKIKTSIGKHPVINYLSTFTNDEIMEGKKHLINRWRRDPSKPVVAPYRSPSPAKRGGGEAGRFKIDVNETAGSQAREEDQPKAEQNEALKTPGKGAHQDTSNALLPKPRAPGGIWLAQSDFPHAFQTVIIYHNIKKYTHNELYQDIWEQTAESALPPYISNQNEVYIKLEMDAEAVQRVQQEEVANRNIGIQAPLGLSPDASLEQLPDGEESKEDGAGEATQRSAAGEPLPGEREKPAAQHDNIIIACAPYPTNKAHEVLPRYLTKIKQVDCEIEGAAAAEKMICQNYKSYFEGVQFKVLDEMSSQQCIWLKPEFNCPQGATLWIASQLRKITIVSKADYLQEQKQFFSKQVSSDYLPQQAGKYQHLGKYEFTIPEKTSEDEPDTILHIKIDTPADRYLLNHIRAKIIGRGPGGTDGSDLTEAHDVVCLNQMNLDDIKLKANGSSGYCLVVEGVMPYNTAEGQLVLDTLCNKEAFALHEVVQCEPVEYIDAYVPTKYGIIFQEKIVISPSDHTSAALNIKLLKSGQEFAQIEGMAPKYFRVDILDNGKPIYSQTGYNQITISHFMFRCNQGLPDKAEDDNPDAEVKHNYVIQALFDLHEWPAGKTANDESADITWQIKMYCSETLALIKDTDKEDREKALKASWEAEEPGRAEKAQISRRKFAIRKKQKAGEELTEEELEVLNEKRERVRKKDQEEVVAAKGGGKGAKAPPAKGKGAPPAKGAPAPEEEGEAAKVVFPEAKDHFNDDITQFLEHFSSSRQIILGANAKTAARKRDDEEKTKILEQFETEKGAEAEKFNQIGQEREQAKEMRASDRASAFKDTDEARDGFKDRVGQTMEERNKYRDMIDGRKVKEAALLELIGQDKADITILKSTIESAQELQVKEKYIKKAHKFLRLMEYVKDFEVQIQGAVAEKNKEALQALLDRLDKENAQLGSPLPIDAKILNDAKGNLAKMK